jgi:hypothetical protein
MRTKDKILLDIKKFTDDTGLKEWRFGLLSVHDHKLVSRLRGKGRIHDETIDKIYDFIKNFDKTSIKSK